MNKISDKIAELKQVITSSINGHLPLHYRVELMRMVENKDTVNKIFFECSKKVFPIWLLENSKDYSVAEILNKADDHLYHSNDKIDFEKTADKYRNHLEDTSVSKSGLAGLSALSLCYSIAYNAASILEIDEYNNEDDNIFDWDVWNPDFYASIAFAGGNPFLGEGDSRKRKEFWLWYLDVVQTLSITPNEPVLKWEEFKIPSNEVLNQFKRTQSYDTETIKEKIEKVIAFTIEDLKEQDADAVWNKIEIEGGCLQSGIGLSANYINKDSNNKVPIELTYYYYDDDKSSDSLMDEIKDEMYEQAKTEGAWLSYFITVLPDLTYKIHFNYDKLEDLPEGKQDLDDLIDEFKAYPRSKDFTPVWWQNALASKKIGFL